jgi:hypothetical protein
MAVHPAKSEFLPNSRKEYVQICKEAGGFLQEFSEIIRTSVDNTSRLNVMGIDMKAIEAKYAFTQEERSKAAWYVLSWNLLLTPWGKNRDSYINLEVYEDLVKSSPDTLYMYAVLVDKQPNKKTLDKLKTMHPENAKLYEQYCQYSSILNVEHPGVLDQLYMW